MAHTDTTHTDTPHIDDAGTCNCECENCTRWVEDGDPAWFMPMLVCICPDCDRKACGLHEDE